MYISVITAIQTTDMMIGAIILLFHYVALSIDGHCRQSCDVKTDLCICETELCATDDYHCCGVAIDEAQCIGICYEFCCGCGGGSHSIAVLNVIMID